MRRRRGRPPSFSRQQIFETALDLVERDGPEAVTMRAIADELGTGPMSLYTHVRGKDDLLEGLARLAFERLDLQLLSKGSWQDRLGAWMHSLRDQVVGHPDLMQLVGSQHYGSPLLLHTCSLAAEILAEAGMTEPEAATTAQGMLWSALGFALLEIGHGERTKGEAPEVQLAMALSALSEDERRTCERFLPHFAIRSLDLLYDAQVDRLIAGIERDLSR